LRGLGWLIGFCCRASVPGGFVTAGGELVLDDTPALLMLGFGVSLPRGLVTVGDGKLVEAVSWLVFGFATSLSWGLATTGNASVMEGRGWLALGFEILLPGVFVATGGGISSTIFLLMTCHSCLVAC